MRSLAPSGRKGSRGCFSVGATFIAVPPSVTGLFSGRNGILPLPRGLDLLLFSRRSLFPGCIRPWSVVRKIFFPEHIQEEQEEGHEQWSEYYAYEPENLESGNHSEDCYQRVGVGKFLLEDEPYEVVAL